MKNKIPKTGGFFLIILVFIVVILAVMPPAGFVTAEPSMANEIEPKWTRDLPAMLCPGSTTDTNCHRSSPVLADLNSDGRLDIIVATNKGIILAYQNNGTLMWSYDVAPAFGMAPETHQILSSPAVGDLDDDGTLDIVVGTGTNARDVCTQGGIIALTAEGKLRSGWPVLSDDWEIPPPGCGETVFSTPALGDLDLDGDLEVIAGGYDKRVFALHHDGSFVDGFPPNSFHYQRFGWEILIGRLGDTIWSSPAVADLSGDGYLDFVIGSDEGNYDSRWKPFQGHWLCPYDSATTPGYCGGSLYGFNRNGGYLNGFPRYIYESISSTPAIMDVDGDGRDEIFVGTGSYYFDRSPDKPEYGFRVYGFNNLGKELPGWNGGKHVGGVVPASPSIGDITGDDQPEIVVPARDRKLYAWHIDGKPVDGFPMTPTTHFNQVLDGYDAGTGIILADYTGDGKMEIFLRHAAEIIIISGSGQQLTGDHSQDTRPAYYAGARVWNNPAVGDLDGDGELEMVVHNSTLFVWDLPDSSLAADWPMFKHDAARTGSGNPIVKIEPQSHTLAAEQGSGGNVNFNVNLYGWFGKYDWTIKSNRPNLVHFSKNSGMTVGHENIQVDVAIPNDLPLGNNSLGHLTVEIEKQGEVLITKEIPLSVHVVKKFSHAYMPFIR